jgi:hypothetical protein
VSIWEYAAGPLPGWLALGWQIAKAIDHRFNWRRDRRDWR